MIYVTKTFLPDKARYAQYVDEIYARGKITNGGPLVKKLEERLAEYLGVKNIVLVANGTVAMEIAYRTLGIKGFAITTPFSFVATTSSLVTNGINPIFADIDFVITSYSIHYTKLYELWSPEQSFASYVEFFLHKEAIIFAKTYHLEILNDFYEQRYAEQIIFTVITSYSIHYTKLYEFAR